VFPGALKDADRKGAPGPEGQFTDAGGSRGFALPLAAGAARRAGGLCNTMPKIGSAVSRRKPGKVQLTVQLRSCG